MSVMDIVGNGPMFRDQDDFVIDAEWRQWLESPEGCAVLRRRRLWQERLHQGGMVLSDLYRSQQKVIEDALKGISGDFKGEVISAEDVIRASIRKTSNA